MLAREELVKQSRARIPRARPRTRTARGPWRRLVACWSELFATENHDFLFFSSRGLTECCTALPSSRALRRSGIEQ
jgi:hypothetical protein